MAYMSKSDRCKDKSKLAEADDHCIKTTRDDSLMHSTNTMGAVDFSIFTGYHFGYKIVFIMIHFPTSQVKGQTGVQDIHKVLMMRFQVNFEK